MDTDIKQDLISFFDIGVMAAFPNDMEKIVKEIGKALSIKDGIEDRESILLMLRNAIMQSDYKDDSEVLEELKDSLNDSDLWETVDKKFKEEKHG